MMKSLWKRHMGHVLLVFLSTLEDGFFVAVFEARQLRIHSKEVRYEGRPWGMRTETEGVITVHQQPIRIRCLETYRTCLLGRAGGGRRRSGGCQR
jgi:hypothetical protein